MENDSISCEVKWGKQFCLKQNWKVKSRDDFSTHFKVATIHKKISNVPKKCSFSKKNVNVGKKKKSVKQESFYISILIRIK